MINPLNAQTSTLRKSVALENSLWAFKKVGHRASEVSMVAFVQEVARGVLANGPQTLC